MKDFKNYLAERITPHETQQEEDITQQVSNLLMQQLGIDTNRAKQLGTQVVNLVVSSIGRYGL